MDVAQKFWKNWYEADLIKRQELMKNIAKQVKVYEKIDDKELQMHGLTTILNSYFEDLAEYMEYVKDKKDKKR